MEIENKLKEIQILLFSLPCTHNKEYLSIIKEYNTEISLENLVDLFDKIFSIQKYTNTEVYHFLNIFCKFVDFVGAAELSQLSNKIRSLRFFPSEKDTDLVIFKYFEVVNKKSVVMKDDELHDVYSRYIFLQSKDVVNSIMAHFIYSKFKEFLDLHPPFLEYTIEKGIFKEFSLKNEFLTDFYDKFSSVMLIDSSFESNLGIRIFIINSTKNKYLVQEFFNDIPQWYLKSLSYTLIPFLYYNFDVYGIYRELALEFCNSLNIEDLINLIQQDKNLRLEEENKNCSIRFSSSEDCTQSCFTTCDEVQLLRSNLKEAISIFNKTMDLSGIVNTFGQLETMMILRLCKQTNLKTLGDFLCKAKNENFLKTFSSTFDFHNLTIIEALKVYLGSFYLVGESQVIHRVLTNFSEKYFFDNVNKCSFMEISDNEKTLKFIFNFSFSLLVLNTKMYNPNIKIKPTFNTHMSDFTEEEIPESFTFDYLQSQFEAVRENKLEFANRNKPGKYHYMVYESICDLYKIPKTLIEFKSFCTACSLLPYQDIFSRLYTNYLNSPPEKFYLICQILNQKNLVEKFLTESKDDTNRFLSMFKFYCSQERDLEIYKLFITVLKRVEKPRHSVFTDIKNNIIKGGSSGEGRENVLSQYRKIINEICNSEFREINLLAEALRSTTNSFVIQIVVEILEKHFENLKDLSMLADDKISLILDKTVSSGNRGRFCSLSTFMSPESLLIYYKNMLESTPRFLNLEVCEAFKEIHIHNEIGFGVVLNIQKEFDLFDFVVDLKEEKIECRGVNTYLEESKLLLGEGNDFGFNINLDFDHNLKDLIYFKVDANKDILSCYTVKEKFCESLKDPTNLFHFYASSKSILNQSKTKTIHKSGCPLKQDLFSPVEMDCRLIYMIKKSDSMNNKDITNYTLWVVNLLSSSLPLFCRFFVDHFGLLLTVKNANIVNPIIKIFCSRLGKSMAGSPLCCSCGYNKLYVVERLIKLLIKYDLATVEDFKFYFKERCEKINLKEIEINNDELILKTIN